MIKEIFPTRYWEAEFPNFDLIKDDMVAEVKGLFDENLELFSKHRLFNNSYSLEGTEEGMYRDLHLRLKNQEVIEFIKDNVKQYWDSLDYTKHITPEIYHMWANLTPKGGNIIHHNHNPFEIAGSFYLDSSPEQGCLAFVNPNEAVLGRLPIYDSQESKQGRFFFDHIVTPKPGKLVLFPGWLYHKTQKNTTDNPRMVLGLNAGLTSYNLPPPPMTS